MRRANPGYGQGPSMSSYLEEENDRLSEELQDKTHLLKSLAIDINTEIKYQNQMVSEMDDDFERTSGALSGSLSRVLRLGKGNHNYYLLYLFLFSLVVFLVLWIIL